MKRLCCRAAQTVRVRSFGSGLGNEREGTVVFPFKKKEHVQDFTFPKAELSGSCSCGSVGFVASGSSSLNFVCHCAHCRAHSGKAATRASAFLPRQVKWLNDEGMKKTTCDPSGVPGGPPSKRRHCSSCGDYIADESPDAMGVVKLAHSAAETYYKKHGGKIEDVFLPNHHIFYQERVGDVNDPLPKWESFPEGNLKEKGSRKETVETRTNYDQGKYRKDVLPMSPTRAPIPSSYWYTEHDAPVNHITEVTQEKMDERRQRKYIRSPFEHNLRGEAGKKFGAIVVGGGHNGLVAAAYLAKGGVKDVLVLERRHLVGGAAVTEELVPGFKFSRASYLAGLLRPKVIEDLQLYSHGLKYLIRDPSSFTPSLLNGPNAGKYLLLGSDEKKNWDSIAQFDPRDADAYPKYEEFLQKVREIVQPILDNSPMNPFGNNDTKADLFHHLKGMSQVVRLGAKHKEVLIPFYELFTGTASHILDRWFESEMLKTTLATDAVIGANISPKHNGSSYVLLHHVMGEAAGRQGVWAYVEGGMGAVSDAIARAAQSHGARIECNASVRKILHSQGRVAGVELEDGTVLQSENVLSGTTPYHTFLELLPGLDSKLNPLPKDFVHHIRFADYACQCFKINIAVDKLPNFECFPTSADGKPGEQHRGTVHFENTMQEIEDAYRESSLGLPATRPVIEMTIPSSLDTTIAPPGKHVVQLFVQYAPYDVDPKVGHWADAAFKEAFVERCLRIVDEFCPSFSDSIIGYDALSPLDLERVFGLHKGSIHHGALALHQLAIARPMSGWSNYRTPLKGLYLAGAGAHPGGGVMGAAGRNAAQVVLRDCKK